MRLESPRKAKRKKGAPRLNDDEGFIIKHFAGDVCYSTGGFVDKNTDPLYDSLRDLMAGADFEFLAALFGEGGDGDDETNGGEGGSGAGDGGEDPAAISGARSQKSSKRSKVTVGGNFRRQLGELMTTLQATTSNFIRCIKPNEQQVPDLYDGASILHQLRCSGMMEALALMQGGYPTRCSFESLYDRYKEGMPPVIANLPPPQFCEALLFALDLDRDDFQLGLTKVFFRSGKMAFLDRLTASDESMADDIVLKVRRWLARKRMRRVQYTALSSYRLWRRVCQRRALERLSAVATTVYALSSNIFVKIRKLRIHTAAARIQATWRGSVDRSAYRRVKAAADTLHPVLRGFVVFKRYEQPRAVLRAARIERLRLEEEARLERERQEAERLRLEEEARLERERQEEIARQREEERRIEAEKRAALEKQRIEEEAKRAALAAQLAEEERRRKEEEDEHLQALKALERELTAAKEAELAAAADSHAGALAGLEETHAGRVAELEARIAELEGLNASLGERVASLEGELETERRRARSAQDEVAARSGDVDSLEARSVALEAKVRDLERARADLESELAGAKRKTSSALDRAAAVEGELDAAESRRRELESASRDLEQQIDALRSDKRRADARAEDLADEVEALQRDLKRSKSEGRADPAMESELAALRTEVLQAKARADLLLESKDDLESEVGRLRSAQAVASAGPSLESQGLIDDLRRSLSDATSKAARAESRSSNLAEEIEALRRDKEQAETESRRLTRENITLAAQLEEAEAVGGGASALEVDAIERRMETQRRDLEARIEFEQSRYTASDEERRKLQQEVCSSSFFFGVRVC